MVCIGYVLQLRCLLLCEVLWGVSHCNLSVFDPVGGLIRFLPFLGSSSVVLALLICLPGPLPGIGSYFIDGLLGPLNHVVHIKASGSVGNVFIHCFAYPACSIGCNAFYRIPLLFGQRFKELSQYLLAVSFMDPDDTVSVMIDHNSDICVP